MDKFTLKFCANSKNEAFARTCVSAFILPINPSVEELSDVKTAVSEAVTNAVVHAYEKNKSGDIIIKCHLIDRELHIKITDFGSGIDNIESAVEPFFTTKEDDERSGMGFTIMRTFMDSLSVESAKNQGTTVSMVKKFK